MRKRKYTKDMLEEAVRGSTSIAGVLRFFGLRQSGGSHRYIKSLLSLYEVNTDHFTGALWSKGKTLGENFYRNQRPLSEILSENVQYSSTRLKHRLIKSGLKLPFCEMCGLNEWRGVPLTLELHHINFNSNDNRIQNLIVLCPNCHTIVGRSEHLG